MPSSVPRGTPTEVPDWWLDEVEIEMKRKGWKAVDLAKAIAKPYGKKVSTIQTELSRFFVGEKDPREPIRTIELSNHIADALGLPPFLFRVNSREEGERVQAVLRDGGAVAKAIVMSHMERELDKRPDLTVRQALELVSPPRGDGHPTPPRPKTGRQ